MNRRSYLALAAGAAVAPRHVRRHVSPRVDAHTREHLGVYVAYQIHESEKVGTPRSPGGRHDVVRFLRARGYEYNPLAAAKHHPVDGRVDDGSYRRVPEEHPDVADYEGGDARIVDAWAPEDCQYHVHLFDAGEGAVELYSHYELRPDLFEPAVSPRRVRTHYRPDHHETYLFGVADDAVRELVRPPRSRLNPDDGSIDAERRASSGADDR